jgi:hypothetical protein
MKKSIVIIGLILLTVTIVSGQKKRPVTLNPKSGFINIDELTCGYGLGDVSVPYSKYFYGLTTMLGYQFNIRDLHVNNSLQCGMGAGILFYDEGPLFPFYFDIRFILNKYKISPFVYGNGGILLNFDDVNDESKLFVSGGGGIRIKIKETLAVTVGPGLCIQMGKASKDAFVNLKVGIVFKPR